VISCDAQPMYFEAEVSQSVWRIGYGMDDVQIGVRFPAGKRMFLSPKASSLCLIPTHPLTQLLMEIRQLA